MKPLRLANPAFVEAHVLEIRSHIVAEIMAASLEPRARGDPDGPWGRPQRNPRRAAQARAARPPRQDRWP